MLFQIVSNSRKGEMQLGPRGIGAALALWADVAGNTVGSKGPDNWDYASVSRFCSETLQSLETEIGYGHWANVFEETNARWGGIALRVAASPEPHLFEVHTWFASPEADRPYGLSVRWDSGREGQYYWPGESLESFLTTVGNLHGGVKLVGLRVAEEPSPLLLCEEEDILTLRP